MKLTQIVQRIKELEKEYPRDSVYLQMYSDHSAWIIVERTSCGESTVHIREDVEVEE